MMKKKTSNLLSGTPSMLLAIGAGFVMASSADLRAALAMGAAVLISLFCSALVVKLIYKWLPNYVKLPAYLLIITGFVSILQMLMQAYFPVSTSLLGVHLATLSVSAVVFRNVESVDEHNHEHIPSLRVSVVTGIFFTAIMFVCALIREVLGNASIFGHSIGFLADYKISSLAGAFGGYLVLAIVLAVINKVFGLQKLIEEKETKED